MQDKTIIYDLYNDFSNDLLLSSQNDLQTCTGLIRSQQRVLRRLFTNPGDYIWHAEYGAGLPQYIGKPLSVDNFEEIKSRILSNIFLEDSVSKIPEPVIALQTIQGGLFCQITYTESSTQQSTVLSFNITKDAFTS
jgi:phage baseplate assembly protein W